MSIAMIILGGVALLLYGTRTLRKGLDRLLGERLGPLLQRLADNPSRAVVGGMGVALLAPSSTSVSLLASQAVRAGYITVPRMYLVLLGADIGLTLMVQLLALHVEHFAPVLILIGVILYQYTRGARSRGTGQIILAFGFQFMGIGLIQNATGAISPTGDLSKLLALAADYPGWMAVLAALLAVVLQSSTATIGLILGLSHPASGAAGLALPPSLAIAAVVGANIGTALTLLLVGWQDKRTRLLGAAVILGKVLVGVLILLPWVMPYVLKILDRTTPGDLSRQVANAHTGFNFIKAIVLFPLILPLVALAKRLLPGPKPGESEREGVEGAIEGPRYITAGPIDGSNLALSQSMREILRVADIVRGMEEDLWQALRKDDEELAKRVSERDDMVDRLDGDIKQFLARLDVHALDPDQAAERLRHLRYLSELESIGDLIDKNLCELALKKIRLRVSFSKEEWEELDGLDRLIGENLLIADAAFHTRDKALAEKLLRHKDHIDRRVRELRDRHFARLTAGALGPPQSSAVHLDLLTNLRRINSHASHVAFSVLQDVSLGTAAPNH
jgi:phosphate:Na+ symporter